MNKSDSMFYRLKEPMLTMAKHICALGALLLMPLSGVNAQCVITDEVRIAAGTMAPPFASCGDVVTYQGYEYGTVQIGDQCWFAENLQSEHYQNGDMIPSGLSNGEWSSTNMGATSVYAENAPNLETYGRLYNWYAADDARGLCPSGWHVPTDGEWKSLEMALGMGEAEANGTGWRGTDQGTQMKMTSGWADDGNGTNLSGFSGLPGGYRDNNGHWYSVGYHGDFWSSTSDGTSAWLRYLDNNYEAVNRHSNDQHFGFSVRCIEDAE